MSTASQLHVMMFTDLVNSSGLKEQLGDGDYSRNVAGPHNRLFRETLERHGGEERDCAGDGFFATFASVSDAVNSALLFQQVLHAYAWTQTVRSATGPCPINCSNDNEIYSFHPGGAMCMFGDGSVRFVAETIDIRVIAQLITREAGEAVTLL